MGKLWKYYLSVIIAIGLFHSCADEYSELSIQERKVLSQKVFKDGGHLRQGSPESMTRIEKAIAIDPNNCDAIRELSVAYLKRGMPLNWHPQFQKAIDCNPMIWVPHRGYLYLWFYRDYKKAIEDFNASDTLTPDFIDAPQGHSVDFWRGIAYLGLKDHDNSIAFFEKHIAKETKDSGEDWVELEAFLYLGIAYYENGNFDEALKNIEKLLAYSKNRTADGYYYKALLLNEKGNLEEAKENANKALEDFNTGYYNSRHYVETLRQLYKEDFIALKNKLDNK